VVGSGSVRHGGVWRGEVLFNQEEMMQTRTDTNGKVRGLGSPPTNDAKVQLEWAAPFHVEVGIIGHADLICHRWSVDGVEEKSKAAKGSKAKKSDDLESYVYRNDEQQICLPGEYLRQSIIHAAKFQQDPRSPRKSAMDLFKAGVVCLTPLAPILCPEVTTEWHYVDRRRVMVQRNGITRHRPAFNVGWRIQAVLLITVAEYISADFLHQVATRAGQLVGVGDNRPTYGRYGISHFKVVNLS
jgi:hypothetical protein